MRTFIYFLALWSQLCCLQSAYSCLEYMQRSSITAEQVVVVVHSKLLTIVWNTLMESQLVCMLTHALTQNIFFLTSWIWYYLQKSSICWAPLCMMKSRSVEILQSIPNTCFLWLLLIRGDSHGCADKRVGISHCYRHPARFVNHSMTSHF